jgi:hypothetical protein
MVQQAIPDALRGRISALGSAGQNGLAGLAAAATSAVAAAVGPGRAVTALAATIASGGSLLALLIARATRTAQKNQPSERKPPAWIPDDRINGRGQ